MAYYLDLTAISLDDYKMQLTERYLIPSQMMLRDEIDERFDTLKTHGLANANDLLTALKTKAKVQKTADATGLPLDYLTVLRRAVNSLKPAPRKLADYPNINAKIIDGLASDGITTSDKLYPLLLTKSQRADFAKIYSCTADEALHLAKLMDVTRLRYVSPLFANLLVASPFNTVAAIKTANPQAMHDTIKTLNADKAFFKGNLGLTDAQFLVDDAQSFPIDLDF